MTAVPSFLHDYQVLIDAEFSRLLPAGGNAVADAMAYSVLAPAKRVRPVLTLLASEVCGGDRNAAVPAAAAIEFVHAASLVLDDLPAMDNAPRRRGRPSAHMQFGEAVAMLSAFELLNRAYATLAGAYEPAIGTRLVALVAEAVGINGLIGGQAADVAATGQPVTIEMVERIHRTKTGALFSAAALAGATVAGASPDAIRSLDAYANNLGLAFQIVDDLLDAEEDSGRTGETVRADLNKATFISVRGVDGARQRARELCDRAAQSLTDFGADADRLRLLAAFVCERTS
jgi:geranylgeranyl diphosphate synthase type II